MFLLLGCAIISIPTARPAIDQKRNDLTTNHNDDDNDDDSTTQRQSPCPQLSQTLSIFFQAGIRQFVLERV